ncbi:protein of unknown function [Burkholderia multivorans]
MARTRRVAEKQTARSADAGRAVVSLPVIGVNRLGTGAAVLPPAVSPGVIAWRSAGALPENEIPDAVAEPQAAPLELRDRPVIGARRIAVGGVLERRIGAEHLQHLLRVVLPVRRAVQVRAGLQARREQRDERRLDQPALVMARLVPRIGEEDVHAVEALRREHVLDHFDRVVLDDADVREILLADQLQQRADARLVHFDAEEVVAGTVRGDFRGRRTHAEADFEDARRLAAEHRMPVGRFGRVGHDEARAEIVERAALAGRHAAGAGDEAADAAAVQRIDIVVAGGGFVRACVVVRRQAGFVRVVHHR